jgi:uncharacterized protein YbjQ (UPF0145 family)
MAAERADRISAFQGVNVSMMSMREMVHDLKQQLGELRERYDKLSSLDLSSGTPLTPELGASMARIQAAQAAKLRAELRSELTDAVGAEISAALEATRHEVWRRLDELNEVTEATKFSQRRTDVKAQERFANIREEIDALWDQLRQTSKPLKACNPPGDSSVSTSSPRSSEHSLGGASSTPSRENTLLQPGTRPEGQRPEPSTQTALAREKEDQLRGPLALLGERQRQQTQELSVLRGAIIEVQTDMSLHAVQTSKLAMRAVELTQEERQEALATLALKERQLKADALNYQQRSNALHDTSVQERPGSTEVTDEPSLMKRARAIPPLSLFSRT